MKMWNREITTLQELRQEVARTHVCCCAKRREPYYCPEHGRAIFQCIAVELMELLDEYEFED